jgi:RNA polymerase sigma factor FliA
MQPYGEAQRVMEKREYRVLKYQEYLKEIAKHIHAHLPGHIDLLDLIEYGQIGLLQAVDRYDSRRGVTFKTYAFYRIRGSIIDGLRGVRVNPRAPYYQEKFVRGCMELREGYENEQVPQSVQDEIEQLKQLCREMTQIYILSLDDVEEPSLQETQEQQLISKDLKRLLRNAIQTLSDSKEVEIIYLHYYRGCSLAEAARILGIHKSWASRLHARAVKHLQKIMCKKEYIGENNDPANFFGIR